MEKTEKELSSVLNPVGKEAIDDTKKAIKMAHNAATGYDSDKNIRSESDLEHIAYEAVKLWIKIAYRSNIDAANPKTGAFLMYEIATRHPFFDGNKRTALMMFLTFKYSELDINSASEKIKSHFPKSWDNKDDKIVNFMLELAQRKYTYEEVVEFVKKTFK